MRSTAPPTVTALHGTGTVGRGVERPPGGLKVQGLTVEVATPGGPVVAVQGVSLQIDAGRTLAVAGESGSGKSLLAMALAGLLPDAARVSQGQAWWDGHSLLDGPVGQRASRAGRDIGVVFQEPLTALNPVLSIGRQLAEVPRLHGHGGAEARAMALAMLERVRLPDPARAMAAYPHQLSGGMRQRVLIAMALILKPRLVIADEPTTALDVTVQAEILALLRSLQQEQGATVLIVSHDLAMLAELADVVAVMYAGRIVEIAAATGLFAGARHPYTRALLAARPPLPGQVGERRSLLAIEGSVPRPGQWPAGCSFAPRCAQVRERCRAAVPALTEVRPGHRVACVEAEA